MERSLHHNAEQHGLDHEATVEATPTATAATR